MAERVILGKHPDTGVIGLWISKAGINARTETNTDNFLFDPSKYLARPFARGLITTFTRGAYLGSQAYGVGTYRRFYKWNFSFVHGLTYVPVFSAQSGPVCWQPWCDSTTFNCEANGFLTIYGEGVVPDAEWSTATPGTGVIVTPHEDARWRYDVPTGLLVSKSTIPAAFAIYRNKVI